jgi:hypothetical protein
VSSSRNHAAKALDDGDAFDGDGGGAGIADTTVDAGSGEVNAEAKAAAR